jgi:hypothetical protein
MTRKEWNMVEQVEQTEQDEHEDHKKRLVVTVHKEDAGGEPYKIPGEAETRISTIVEKFYTELGTARKEGDRLYCLMNGDDVFPHEHQELGEYAEKVCKALEWGFSRPTGGA